LNRKKAAAKARTAPTTRVLIAMPATAPELNPLPLLLEVVGSLPVDTTSGVDVPAMTGAVSVEVAVGEGVGRYLDVTTFTGCVSFEVDVLECARFVLDDGIHTLSVLYDVAVAEPRIGVFDRVLRHKNVAFFTLRHGLRDVTKMNGLALVLSSSPMLRFGSIAFKT
jgi:hypothetical protein